MYSSYSMSTDIKQRRHYVVNFLKNIFRLSWTICNVCYLVVEFMLPLWLLEIYAMAMSM